MRVRSAGDDDVCGRDMWNGREDGWNGYAMHKNTNTESTGRDENRYVVGEGGEGRA